MDSLHCCPLDRQAFLSSEQPMGLQRLKEIEEHLAANSSDCPHPPLKELVFDNNSIIGSNPLILACHCNELDSVKHIVENWGVDVNQAAAYYFHPFKEVLRDDLKIEKASPLFVAASMGHLGIVRYLVDHGADVSAKTSNETNADYDRLSPLYGAVLELVKSSPQDWDKELENRSAIVRLLLESGADPSIDTVRPSDGRPMWKHSSCDIDAIISALIEQGMNVNHRYPNLDEISLLNYCIEWESLAVVEFLVDRGADLHIQDSLGLTPIIRAAVCHQWDVVDFFLGRNEISRIDKIEALELVGAILVAVVFSDTEFDPLLPKALDYWRRSLNLRLMDTDGYGPIIKNLPEHLKKPGRIVEWTTSEELEHVIQHPAEQEIQAFLIQSRILSAKSWAAVDPIYSDYQAYEVSGLLAEERRFVELLNMFWSMLETILSYDAREKLLWLQTLQVVGSLINILCHKIARDDPLLNENTIKKSLELILATDQFHLDDREKIDDDSLSYYMDSFFDLIVMLAELPHLVNEESMEFLTELVQRDQRRNPVQRELRRNPVSEEYSLLHMACGNHSYIEHLAIPTVDLLLRAGADPNAGYRDGNGVFHAMAIASKQYNIDASIQESVARLLLDAGAHLHRVNNSRKTAADLWMNPPVTRKRRWYINDWLITP